jgi:polysaccharide deacetylase 2 family uncharacterized protein YibQ
VSDLSAPLTRRRARAADAKRHFPVGRLALAASAALLLAVTLRVVLVDTPTGGRPSVAMPINDRNSNPVASTNSLAPTGEISVGPEISLEKLADATVEAPDQELDEALATPDAMGNLPTLVEESSYGPLPRISDAGIDPFSAYARASVTPATAEGRPLIAIIVTGLGLNLAGTLEAIEQLPDAVTLAFAPYGDDLGRAVGAARAEGHEILLEVPLEPFDYPENDPGPDTLLTGQAPRDNMNRLFAVMGRIGGYVGLINNMGARFTASAADFGPMMEELGARGLGYVDDGSSNRSLAAQLAGANRVPFSRADRVLDSNPARAPILEALGALEVRANEQGSAIGIISALPVSVQTVTEWARDLEERNILIVPASALMK